MTKLYLFSIVLIFQLFNCAQFNLNAQVPQGFFLDNWQAKNISNPTFISTPVPSQTPTATVTVDMSTNITKVSKYVYGHNAAVFAGQNMIEDLPLLSDIDNLDPNIIRWPGGNMSNDYFWDATSQATCPTDLATNFVFNDQFYGAKNDGWYLPLSGYYDLLTKTKSTGIICVNYAYARYGTSANPVAKAAHYAANWVRADKGRTKYWEIGNENYGDWETGFVIDTKQNKDGQPATISGDLYGRHCRVFIDSMRKAAAEIGSVIKIGVVAFPKISTTSVVKDWNKGLMPQVASKADFMVIHSYYTPWGESSSVATILNSANDTKGYKDLIGNDLMTYANHAPLPVALTEWNISAEGNKQQVSYISGVFSSLLLGELIKNKYGQASRWDFINSWSDGNDHGLFASSNEPGISVHAPHASFFYMYYFQKYFGDNMVNSTTTGNANVVSYASKFSSGQSGIVLVNKGTGQETVNLKMSNFSVGKRYYYYLLTGGSDNGDFSRKVYVNGQTTAEEAGGPGNYATIQPKGSDIINGSIKLTLPEYGVLYVLVENGAAVTSVTGVSLSPTTVTINKGATTMLTETILPSNATNKTVTFSSANSAIASVNANGLVTGIAAGTVVITVKTADGAKTATCSVKVNASTSCSVLASTGDFSVTVSNDASNPTLTFVPNKTGIGATTCLLYYGTSVNGSFPGSGVSVNSPFRITATAGSTVYFYYTYSLPTGGENNTSATKNSFTVGNCSSLKSAFVADNSLDLQNVSVYPNPVENGEFTLTLNSYLANEKAIVEINDISGKLVYSSTFLIDLDGSKNIHLSSNNTIKAGLYLITVRTNNSVKQTKIIVKD